MSEILRYCQNESALIYLIPLLLNENINDSQEE